MHWLSKPSKYSACVLLLMLPACQCVEGHWPWLVSSNKIPASSVTEPPAATMTLPLPASSKTPVAAEPRPFEPPSVDIEPPAVTIVPQDRVVKREVPVETAISAPPAPAPTDPVRLPVPVQDPLTSAVQFYRDGRPDEAINILSVYEAKDQDVLLCLLPLLAQFSRGRSWSERITAEELAVVVQQLRSVLRDLQRRAPLQIDRAVFCEGRGLEGYGQPLVLPSAVFRPGDRVTVYVQVQNLTDRQIRNDQYAVHLSGMLEIHGADGKPVWEPKVVQGTPSISQSPRSDHFTLFNFSVPRNLVAGAYTLNVTVTDQDTHRQARKSLPFRVASAIASQ